MGAARLAPHGGANAMRLALVMPGGLGRRDERFAIPALLALIERLAQRHSVTVVTLHDEATPVDYELLGARVLNLGAATSRFSGARLREWRGRLATLWGDAPPPDVVHAFWLGETALLALDFAPWRGVPKLGSLNGGELVSLPEIRYGGGRNWRTRGQARRVARRLDAVTYLCDAVKPSIAPHARTLHHCPLYPDIAVFQRPDEQAPGPPWRLITSSSINAVKDPWTLLRAFAIVCAQLPETRLTWCGADVLHGETQRLAATLGVANRVDFAGLLAHRDLPARFHEAHLYVQASRHEGQGVSVCEAAAAGLALVGTDVGILSEMVAHGAAVTTPTADPARLAVGILDVLGNPARWRALSTSAAAWAATRTADVTAAAHEEIYSGLAARHGA